MSTLLNSVKKSWYELIVNNSHYANTVNTLNKIVADGGVVVPSVNSVFKAFTYFEVTETKMIVLGMDPYPNPDYAMGLAFSVPKGVTVPMSLKNIYKEMQTDGIYPFSVQTDGIYPFSVQTDGIYPFSVQTDGIYPFSVQTEEHGDLTQWAERGVLLLNTALTLDQSLGTGSHCKLWEPFINELLQTISTLFRESSIPVTYLLMGNHAKGKSKYICTNDNCTILMSAHPSPLSYRLFKGSQIVLHALESVQMYYPEFTLQLS